MPRYVIVLSGPIGAGKTTLGRGLATRLSGHFIDGDEFSPPGVPWFSRSLQTSRGIVQASLAAVEHAGIVVVAYPLRRTSWVFFKRSFEDRGVRTVFVSLRAAYTSIIDDTRGRVFSSEERNRIRVMIAEGYGIRPFSDLIVDTDVADVDHTLAGLEREIRHRIEH